MWERVEDRLALLELLSTARLPRRRSQQDAWTLLAEQDWTRTATRRDELVLDERHRGSIGAVLDRVWPDWREVDRALADSGRPPTPKGWEALRDAERAAQLGALPDRLNRRTAAAAVAPHSKATLTPARLAALGEAELTRDGSVRLRPPAGLILRRGDHALDAAHVASILGEVAISERAFRDGLEIVGPIEALLLVENLGAFQDLAQPKGWLVAHVAGWDTATVVSLLRMLAHVPVVHFGDLDPNGLRIVRHLRTVRPDLRWAVPAFWEEWVPDRALAGAWPEDLDVSDAPSVVQRLAADGLWLEQEGIVLDERLPAALMTARQTRR